MQTVPANSDSAQLDHKAQRVIHRTVVTKGSSDLWLQQNQVGARLIVLGVFAADPSFEQVAQIVFGA
jgi:hypothetical protein